MNVRPSEATLVVRFSGAAVDHVDELEPGIRVAYDSASKIVDIAVRARTKGSRLDLAAWDVGSARVSYDAEVDAVAIDALDSKYRDSDEVIPNFIVDYDTEGFVRGFEFLDASEFFSDQAMANIRKCAKSL